MEIKGAFTLERVYKYAVHFYRDRKGREPIPEILRELKGKSDKASRIRLHKVIDFMKILAEYGTRAGEPYIKHLDGPIWELRPLRDRILFARGLTAVLCCFMLS